MSLITRARWVAALVAAAASAAHGQASVRFDEYSLVRVAVPDEATANRIESLGAIIMNCNHGPGKLDVVATPAQIAGLARLGLDPTVIEPNVQAAIERQRRPAPMVAGGDPFDDFFLDYHPYDGLGGIAWYMNELVTRYPGLVSMVNMGTTLEGRTIWGVRVSTSSDPDTPGVVYFGCEHAREWITTAIPLYLARHLLENYGTDALVTDLVDNVEFFLVPVFNVDGYVYTWTNNRLWRKNRRPNPGGSYGIDINRNWGEGWGGPGASTSPSSDTYRGPSPFSEPETQALRDFFLNHPNVRGQLDIHSYSQLILWPFGYTPSLSVDDPYYSEVGSAMQSLIQGVYGTTFHIGPTYTTIYPASGVSVDWTYAQRDILSMAFECRDTGQFGFLLPADQIVPSGEELIPAILHMTNTDWIRQPARFHFPDGLPRTIMPGQTTIINVEIVPQTDTIESSTAFFHYRYDPLHSFTQVQLIPTGGDFYDAVLPPTNCSSTPEFYFDVETQGGMPLSSPRHAPSGEYHSAAMQSERPVFVFEDLSANPGWSVEGSWQWGQPLGMGGAEGGGPDPTSGHTGSNVYGYNLAGDYPNSLPERHLTSPPFDCTGRSDVRLDFWRWLGVEVPAWDHASIRVSADGVNWTLVWQNSGEVADTAWVFQSVDVSAVADNQPSVRVRWTMGPADSAFRYCGWNVDDVALSAGECNGLVGDLLGDGDVDTDDLAQFDGCFAGSGVPRAAGCGVFDVDSDGDVDCDDWVEFHAAWTGPGSQPANYAACADRIGPTLDAGGARYLHVIPAAGDDPVAIRVTSSDHPCLSRYVDFDGSIPQLGRLVDSPVYRLPAEWGDLLVADAEITADAAYSARTETMAGKLSQVQAAATLQWGDVAPLIGEVNVLDISAVVDCLKESPTAPPSARCDLHPQIPDYAINVIDLSQSVDAVKGLTYPFTPPCP